MLPQGILWQQLRQKALDVAPTGVGVDFRAPITLAKWQSMGTYTIDSTSSTKFTIEVAPADFGSALLSDAAFHLDHALEHEASVMNSLTAGHWSSPAWQVVTFYYWAYFAAMALSRLLGRTVWFVTPEVAKQFTKMAPTGTQVLTQGTYEVICGDHVSASIREIRLEKRPRRVHEQLWATVFNLFDETYKSIDGGVESTEESRLFLAIMNSARVLGNEWPSALRNLVNYRPGFAYTSPRFKRCIEPLSYLVTQPQTVGGVVARLEDNTIAMRREPGVEKQPKIAAFMLADLTLLVSRMAHALHDEVIDRGGIDRRWWDSKRRFCVQQGLLRAGAQWPC